MLISSDIQSFSQALKDLPVVCSSMGYWTTLSPSIQGAQALFGADKHRLMKVAKVFARCLDDLEKIPAATDHKREDFPFYVEAAETLQSALEKTHSKRAAQWSQKLKSRVVALQTRSQLAELKPASRELIDKVNELASEWKTTSHIKGREDLDDRDIARLRRVEGNGAFVEQLTEDEDLRSRFFNWVLRDRVDPEPFIEFPAICQRLTEARLSHRIGFYGGGDLKVRDVMQSGDTVKRDLTLPMGGRDVSLLDDRLVVQLEKGYSQTVDQIIGTFINRQWEIGNVDYFKGGIRNWNAKRLGPYNPETRKYERIDFDRESWWEQLPVVEELSIGEASSRYNLPLNGNQWVMAVRAAREQEDDSPINIHGWMHVAIPVNGRYCLYDFGKYTEEFPRAWYEFIDVTLGTVPGVVTYPDEAVFTMDRQHSWHAVSASPDKGRQLLDSVKEDMANAEDGNLPFQFLANNCVKWAWAKINEVVGDEVMPPDVVQMDFTDLRPSGILGKIFSFVRLLPAGLQWFVLTIFVALLGAWKGMRITQMDGTAERVSLLTSLPWGKGEKFYSPCQVFRFTE